MSSTTLRSGPAIEAQVARELRAAAANPRKRAELQLGPMPWLVWNRQMRRILARRARDQSRGS